MKPKPLVALNHLTVPVAILLLQDAQMRVVPARSSGKPKDLRAKTVARTQSDFSDVLGSGAGSARSTSKSIVRMGGVYAAIAKIARRFARCRPIGHCPNSPPSTRSRRQDANGLHENFRKFYSCCAV